MTNQQAVNRADQLYEEARQILSQEGDCDIALELINKAIEICPTKGQYFHCRALANFSVDDQKEAKYDLFTSASKGYQAAIDLLHKIFYPNAQLLIEMEDETLSENPNDVSSYLRRASLNRNIDPLSALSDYSKVLEIAPEKEEVFLSRGSLNRLIGNIDKAMEDINKFLEINPESIIGLAELGFLQLDNANYSDAVKEFKKCLKIDAVNNSEREYQISVYEYLESISEKENQ